VDRSGGYTHIHWAAGLCCLYGHLCQRNMEAYLYRGLNIWIFVMFNCSYHLTVLWDCEF